MRVGERVGMSLRLPRTSTTLLFRMSSSSDAEIASGLWVSSPSNQPELNRDPSVFEQARSCHEIIDTLVSQQTKAVTTGIPALSGSAA